MRKRRPSMFSKNYQKQMKKRKIRNTVITVSVVLVAGIAIYSFFIKNLIFNNNVVSNEQEKNNVEQIENKKEEKKEETPKVGENKKEEKKEEQLATKELAINDKNKIKMAVNPKDKTIQTVEGNENLIYDINPSKKNLVVLDKETQQMFTVDIDGNLKDISNTQYVSTDGQVFTKESIMQGNPQYVWCSNPKFVDDNNIAYVSYLPWIASDNSLYVWLVNLDGTNHRSNYGIVGKDIVWGNLINGKGLSLTVDGNNIIINNEGNIVY